MNNPFLLRWRVLLTSLLLACTLLATGCGDDEDDDEEEAAASQQSISTPQNRQSSSDQSVVPTETSTEAPGSTSDGGLVSVTEPTEQAYTVKVPEGWKNHTALVQVYDMKRPLVTAIKPGGDTFLFLGDPQMPAFTEPNPQFDSGPLANSNPLLKSARFTPAKQFFTTYLTKKFGKLPDFRIVGAGPNPRLDKMVRASAQKMGMNGKTTTVLIAFDYRDNGKLIRSLVNGLTLQNGSIWVADLSGVSSTDDPIQYHDLLLKMSESFKTNPEWQQKQMAQSQQRHEATMAMIRANTAAMTRRHEANMAAIQASSARHQERMAALQASGDARVNAWKEQQAQSDASHERFLNYIKGENTVVNSSGATSQVEAGQDRYFRNKTNNTYIGTDSTKELEDLRKIWGLNPNDYENVKIKR